jgi:hypothetical protein
VKITSAQIVTQVKTWILPIIIFLLSFLLAQEMMLYFKDFNFASLSLLSLPKIGGIMLLLAFIMALSMPAWEDGKFLLILPLPFSLGIYLNLLILEPLNALIVCGFIFLISTIHVDKSLKLQHLLIKSLPHISLRPAIKGYLLAVSIAATFIVLLNPKGQDVNIGSAISGAISSPIQGLLSKEANLNTYLGVGEQKVLEQQIEKEVTTKVKSAIEPYRHLLNIIMAGAVFIGMQGLNAIIYLIFSLGITPLFWLVKKTHFILSDWEQVQREHLHF